MTSGSNPIGSSQHEHLPLSPGWTCGVCGVDWPCAQRQQQLLAEYGADRANLGIYLGACLGAALTDLPAVPAGELRKRFMGWLPRDRGRQ